jgi:hypothetical protein
LPCTTADGLALPSRSPIAAIAFCATFSITDVNFAPLQ